MRKSWLTASLLALTVASPFAAADIQGHKAGDFIIRGGFATVDPDDSSSDIKLDGAKQRGTKATVDSDTQLGLTFTYMFADKWGVELVAATPFNHQVDVKGLGPGLDGKLADIKQLPPTLLLQYYPMGGTNSAFQPYGGLGVNYTTFFDEDLASNRKAQGFSSRSCRTPGAWPANWASTTCSTSTRCSTWPSGTWTSTPRPASTARAPWA